MAKILVNDSQCRYSRHYGSCGGEYQKLVAGELIRYSDKFDDPNLPGEIQVTVSLM